MIKEIFKKCKTLNISEERTISDEYLELVFESKETDKWSNLFTEIFGPAAKPAGAKPTKEDLVLTKDYGGIYFNQTLFKKDFSGVAIMAMFWPWQNGVLTTLKVTVLQK
jgi:hypothetical protein